MKLALLAPTIGAATASLSAWTVGNEPCYTPPITPEIQALSKELTYMEMTPALTSQKIVVDIYIHIMAVSKEVEDNYQTIMRLNNVAHH
ncbi:hypothetical protein VHEMI04683 [[Torrubiella] hemipterigena]|uniref:Uncharacterized protein n=1 Tax=[Torrubiella] hemipterigena TaxID=1531966 RepID=A0A0A1TGW0_9HYPO|nr:hypothetical protein VHEMI04683 [[Torrubiella] hemipterigena]